jgi:lysophospholipase L1-like esterase
MSSADAHRYSLLGASLLAALVAATCSRARHLEPLKPVARPSAVSSSPSAPAGSAPGPVAAPGVAKEPARGGLPLTELYAALRGLAEKKRQDHVRILWLGDSHTAADYLTGAVRRKLEERFGSGGPGFLRLGASPYRHDGVKVTREGRFRTEPEPPSRRTKEGDTAFGIGGFRTIPVSDSARAEVRIDERRVQGTVRYELLFELTSRSSFRVTLGSARTVVKQGVPLLAVNGSPIARLRFEAPAKDGFALDQAEGAPRIYGVIAEGSVPGVVLDTSGIDGARIATGLSWDQDALAAELKARPPNLFAVAYGTNEAFDNRRAEVTGTELEELVSRLRKGAPSADCLVVGPPDAALPDFNSLPRVAEMDAALQAAAGRIGCAFFSLRRAMGGDGGFARYLKETPQLALSDRIHLTPAGYAKLGEMLGDELLSSYDRGNGPRP